MLNLPPIDNDVVWRFDPTGTGITVTGNIDSGSLVFLQTGGNITIEGKIDGGSQVTLKAGGNVFIGTSGGADNEKVDGNSAVTVIARGSITFGSYFHKASADLSAHGTISIPGEINYGARIRAKGDGGISLGDKIDGSSRVELVSNRGVVGIGAAVTGKSKVWLTAFGNIHIGQQIDGDSFVSATAGAAIAIGDKIADSHTIASLAACGAITVDNKISGGARARLKSAAGSITVSNGISDSATEVIAFPVGALTTSLNNGAQPIIERDWTEGDPLCLAAPLTRSWWENWSQTFGYVVPQRTVPRSLEELVAAVAGNSTRDHPDTTPVKAVGGGWSFTDASLPLAKADVDRVSIFLRGRRGQQGMHDLLLNLPDAAAGPMDLLPGAVTLNHTFSTMYNQVAMRQITVGGAQLASPTASARVIDTRNLASSLQCEFYRIRSADTRPGIAGRPPALDEILFHVEAGITMADLQQLLDHQFPRLALEATGGSPGATLAGTLSSATHGGEFSLSLLIDQVRAIHLVGPGGEQWWIEGDVPVADQGKLQLRYPKIDPAHFIGGAWNGIPGLNAQDVLNAVTVSMGTMGAIYSVVIAVKPQFGIRQIVTSMKWEDLLKKAGVTEAQLRSGSAAANSMVLDTLLSGDINGTGILKANNIYADLAINPINLDCWIVNREKTPSLPDDPNPVSTSINDYLTTLGFAFGEANNSNGAMNRVIEFLGWSSAIDLFPNVFNGGPETTSAATNLVGFLTGLPDVMGGALAIGCMQAVANMQQDPSHQERGLDFFGSILSGVFHAMQGTRRGRNSPIGTNSNSTGVSYKVGAIGWPDSGVPGRGFEIALDSTNAFTFLQAALMDDVLTTVMRNGNNPLVGYISIRICPPTRTLLGMQQFSPFSVMIEVVAYRSPEANTVMDAILNRALTFTGLGPKPILHWGLENDMVTAAHLAASPLGGPYKAGMTRLDAFRAVRNYLRHGHPPVFDNAFTARMGI